MRVSLATIIVLALPAIAAAQSPPIDPAFIPALPPIGLPLPQLSSPLAPIGLPLPPIGFQWPSNPVPTRGHQAGPARDHQPGRGGPHDRARFDSRRDLRQPAVIYVVPGYGWGMQQVVVAPTVAVPMMTETTPAPVPVAPARREVRAYGVLRLELEGSPRALQLYVDNYFVGSPDDNRDFALEPGPHTVEIRGEGYETLTFDVKIAADQTITYRGSVRPDGTAAPAPLPTAAASTYYFIPGCYIGNVAPEKVTLPANCDLSRLVTYKP